jgi:hypothetical protein
MNMDFVADCVGRGTTTATFSYTRKQANFPTVSGITLAADPWLEGGGCSPAPQVALGRNFRAENALYAFPC